MYINKYRYFYSLVGLSVITIIYYGYFYNYSLLPVKLNLLNEFSELKTKESLPDDSRIEEGGLITLEANSKHYRKKIKGGEGNVFLLEYDVQLKNLVGTDQQSWYGFRLVLYPEMAGRLIWSVPHLLFHQKKDGTFQGVSRLVFDENYSSYTFSIELLAQSGQAVIKQINLGQYRQPTVQMVFEYALIILWGVLFVVPMLYLKEEYLGHVWGKISLLIFITITIGVMVPNQCFKWGKTIVNEYRFVLGDSQEIKVGHQSDGLLKQQIQKKKTFNISIPMIKKMGHFGLFAMLTLALCQTLPPIKPIRVFYIMLLFAMTSEIAQLNINSRVTSIHDFGIDFIGILFAFLFYLVIRRFRLSKWSRYFYF